jgi:hypothetical protein
MRRISLLVLVTAFSLAGIACGGSGEGSATNVVDPGPSVSASFEADLPAPGLETVSMREASRSHDVVTVRIDVTGATDLYGAGFDVTYDPTTAQYVGYSPGTALERSSSGSVIYQIDNGEPGRVVVGVALVGSGVQGVNIPGTAPLVHLTFRMLDTGAAPVAFEGQPALFDDQPTPQPIAGTSWFGGTLVGV